MAIQIICECGQAYRVADTAAGKRVKCKKCEAVIDVPQAADEVLVEAVIVEQPEPRVAKQPVGPSFDPANRERMQRDLDYISKATDSAASNPGMLRVSYMRYAMAFPKWVLIWLVLFLLSLPLVFVHWAFGLLVVLFGLANYLYWRGVKYQFIGGCINPGKILSLDPPLVAVCTDLTKGHGEYLAIKVLPQPLHRMSSGAPELGQRVATIAGYAGINDDLDHWDDFWPIVPDVVTRDQNALQRILASIDEESWQELQTGIEQLPSPLAPGLYRIFDWQRKRGGAEKSAHAIVDLVNTYLTDHMYFHNASEGIKPKKLQQASAYIPPGTEPQVLGLAESSSSESDASEGFAFTATHVFFHFKEVGKGSFLWSQLVGALATPAGLELGLDGQVRMVIPKKHFLSKGISSLDLLFNAVAESDA